MYNPPPANDLAMYDANLPPLDERRVNWWLRLTSVSPSRDTSFGARERVRRSRLASWLILGILVFDLLLIPLSIGSTGTVVAIASAFVGLIIAAICNRLGWVTFSAIFLVIVITAAVFGSIVSEPNGLTMFDLPGYDILVVTVVIAASILPASSAFVVAIINAGLVVLDFNLQPYAPDVVTNIQLYGAVGLLARPVALLFIVAIVGYLWVRGTHREVMRADKAERTAAIEHAYAEQRHQLEVGVQQILATHVRIANGDYSARAPLSQDNVLWQVAASLNNLVVRLRTAMEQASQSGRAAYQLARTEDESHRLAIALRDLQAGRQPIWPGQAGTSIDELVAIMTNRERRPSTLPSPPNAPMYGRESSQAGAPQQGPGWPPFPGSTSSADPSNANVPSWFFSGGQGSAADMGQMGPGGQSGWLGPDGAGGPNSGGPSGQPSQSAGPYSRPAPRFNDGWPSLDQNSRENASGQPDSNSFPDPANPWFLPPDS